MPRVYSKSSEEEDLDSLNASSTPNQGHSARKKHICATCDRCFTTSGHLARHSRVHTGEKNHKCPFPGCETRCSRQDNLQQHYRIHLSPGSRRTSSSRASASRRGKRATAASAPQQEYADQAPLSPPPLVPATLSASPPPLERAPGANARASIYSPPPDSPPPLAHATMPATYQHGQGSPSSSSASSPQLSYTSPSFPSMTMSPPPLAHALRNGPTSYQEEAGHSVWQNSPAPSDNYPHSDGYINGHYSLPRIDTLTKDGSPHSASASPSANSRHSISHISHSQSQVAYQRTVSAASSRPGTGPSSPASSHSASHSIVSHSAPPTPNGYTSYEADSSSHSSPYDHGVSTSPSLSAQSGVPILEPSISRYSPPPILAPIQGFPSHDSVEAMSRSGSGVRIINEHYERKPSTRAEYSDRYYEARYTHDEPRYGRAVYGLTHDRHDISSVQSYMAHQPSAMAGYHDMYSPAGHISLSHGAWKSEHLGSRTMKSINALVQ